MSDTGATVADHEPLDLVWGAASIAKVIGQTTRATYHMLEAGELPARQVGQRRWVASRKALEVFFAETAS